MEKEYYKGYAIWSAGHFLPEEQKWEVRFYVGKETAREIREMPFELPFLHDSQKVAEVDALAAARAKIDQHIAGDRSLDLLG
ncbi:CV_2116 domain-containing protein [Chromobacterium haemolyticum]|uniref:CV_2116 domain-containing protein n=1 Tax=Chromobacterium haemolyticum TaxID=394935 RepID=UPI000D317F34|nr:hypothetical protein [Chromobacterium haemolyticum]PTU67975.1 hypothetical protein DBB33_00135 [Chromobacterium haemolyticum]